jgi:hypothetical protein
MFPQMGAVISARESRHAHCAASVTVTGSQEDKQSARSYISVFCAGSALMSIYILAAILISSGQWRDWIPILGSH